MRFTTETGSVYEIREVNGLHREVRRVNPGMGKRAVDDEGDTCVAKPPYYGEITVFYGEDA